jgi:3-methylcrotonyl-CoA carboxylase alpha subunit
MLTREAAPAPESLLLAAAVALDERVAAAAAHSPWSQADAWRMGGPAAQSIGLRTTSFQRLRAQRRGDRLDIAADGLRLAGRVRAGDHGRIRVEAGDGERELELIRCGNRLQVVGARADEITITSAWPHERGVEDADAHPASPLPGRVVDLRVQPGDSVAKGDVLAVVEGMKMQYAIRAGRAGRVTQVLARAGELVEAEAVLFDIEPL